MNTPIVAIISGTPTTSLPTLPIEICHDKHTPGASSFTSKQKDAESVWWAM